MGRFLRDASKAPLAMAALLAFPLFLASLMALSLAIESPRLTHVRTTAGKLRTFEHVPSAGAEARIWLLALVPSAIVVLVGVLSTPWRRGGVYPACAAAIVLSLLLPLRLDTWTARHSRRFPIGMDLVPDSDPSNLASRGEWESQARNTVDSLSHWTIGLALAAALVVTALAIRRRLGPVPPPPPPPPAVAEAQAQVVARGSTLNRWFRGSGGR